ncbi:MAG: bifunctional phosphopantothenoylcysteine decarboxylase/phosphopantothenate--cysteine ligase CoaBC [Lachnospiraceae bacterium]|nr:bifunctional phosphopantothenoylcysteine decarboxylase/phosphopantothenate--cysteine ligase CoaBC [Lachnospiraceae bacterium]
MLTGKTIILGVTGCIAAYKSAYLASALTKAGADVHVVMTKNATEFVGPHTFEALTGNRVSVDTFDRNYEHKTEHISLADAADLVIVAPATANSLAKFAHGIADDMLSTVVLACDCPKMAAPAMNTKMYLNEVTQDNIGILKNYGWEILDPASGRLACGTSGPGRMPEPEVLFEAVVHAAAHEKDMHGLKVLVTAGPTREALDPVRFITNHSSGTMGYAIAKAAAARGAKVTLVSGPVALTKPSYVDVVDVTSAKEMYDAVTSRAPYCDIVIKAAAVADYRPAVVADEKIKKAADGSDSDTVLQLERTDDILAALGRERRDGQFLCGFSMETQNVLENSRRKLFKKNLDMIAANSIREEGAGFGAGTNHLTLITADEEIDLPKVDKEELAYLLLDEIMKRR